jgi:hypothetical protein
MTVHCTNCGARADGPRLIYDERHGDIYEVCGRCGWDILDMDEEYEDE